MLMSDSIDPCLLVLVKITCDINYHSLHGHCLEESQVIFILYRDIFYNNGVTTHGNGVT